MIEGTGEGQSLQNHGFLICQVSVLSFSIEPISGFQGHSIINFLDFSWTTKKSQDWNPASQIHSQIYVLEWFHQLSLALTIP